MKKIIIASLYITALFLSSCTKEWLEQKPNDALAVPATLGNFQGLLDNTTTVFNSTGDLPEMSSDDYYLTNDRFNALTSNVTKNAYTWATNLYEGRVDGFYYDVYKQVFYCNTVLDGMAAMDVATEDARTFNDVKGQALFLRSYAFFTSASLFSAAYDSASEQKDAGVPIRLTSDINAVTTRATVKETYDRIIGDLKTSIELLPVVGKYRTRPTKAGAYSMLARVFVSMRKYNEALKYADSALALNNSVLDYNTLLATDNLPLPAVNSNPEIIFYDRILIRAPLNQANFIVDSTLYASYATNDLRKDIFYRLQTGFYTFKGSYLKSTNLFTGLATDELYLIRAECYARSGNLSAGLADLNKLLVNRWKRGTYVPVSAGNSNSLLNTILSERRKELVYRNLRWMDLKRLNKEGANIVLKRILSSGTFTLPANDARYVFPFPDDVIRLTGIQQNIR